MSGNHGEIRLDRRSVESHADDTHAQLGNMRGSADAADRSMQYLQSMSEGGVGADEYSAVAASARHSVEDIQTDVSKFAKQHVQGAQDLMGAAQSAANKNLRA